MISGSLRRGYCGEMDGGAAPAGGSLVDRLMDQSWSAERLRSGRKEVHRFRLLQPCRGGATDSSGRCAVVTNVATSSHRCSISRPPVVSIIIWTELCSLQSLSVGVVRQMSLVVWRIDTFCSRIRVYLTYRSTTPDSLIRCKSGTTLAEISVWFRSRCYFYYSYIVSRSYLLSCRCLRGAAYYTHRRGSAVAKYYKLSCHREAARCFVLLNI